MLHALYIVAFTILAFLAVGNLFRNLMLLGADARRPPRKSASGWGQSGRDESLTPHPEMLDERGRVLEEPLLMLRSISLEDARERLDALYEGTSNQSEEASEED